MKPNYRDLERRRLVVQTQLDGKKTASERNKMGQFATPSALAQDILRFAGELLPTQDSIRFLDPALGTGAFYSALRNTYGDERVAEALGFEIDPHYGHPSKDLWSQNGLTVEIRDFTTQTADPRFNLIICNPPYVRHHHLSSDYKARLQTRTTHNSGIVVSGLAGLYCHFLGISHRWMAADGIAGWLIPSEFMDVNYGRAIKQYLLNKVTLLRIHRFDPNDVQFADALVSSAIVWLRNSPPPVGHAVEFSFGGTLFAPDLTRTISAADLSKERKWTRFPVSNARQFSTSPILSDFFTIKRGLATGDNSFFILPEDEIIKRDLPMQAFRPVLPSPRYLTENEVEADVSGNPRIDRRLFLLDTRMKEEQIKNDYPKLWQYLENGKTSGLKDRYLCRHRPVWYAQENRPAPPIVCTYIGRSDTKSGKPFRFILNHSKATVANVYLAMYPTPLLERAIKRDDQLIRKVWMALNEITPDALLSEGRVYGGGLHKLEPKELANVPVATIGELIGEKHWRLLKTEPLEFSFK
jgi:adenine-specific DNA-methyltransferase